VFLFDFFFLEVIGAPAARGLPSEEVPQRGPLPFGSVRRLVELGGARRTLFTPPPPTTPAMAARVPATIGWQNPPASAEEWEEMRRMALCIMELFVTFAERFLMDPATQATRDC